MLTLRAIRKSKGLTMKELGRMVDCTESAISMYELGKRQPDFETLLKLAEALDTSVSVILGESPFVENKKAVPDDQAQLLNLSAAQAELVRMMERLSEDDQKMLLRLAKAAFPSPSED